MVSVDLTTPTATERSMIGDPGLWLRLETCRMRDIVFVPPD